MRHATILAFLTVAVAYLEPVPATAFENSYDCREVAETSIDWNAKEGRYSTTATTSLKRPAIIKLSDLNGANPSLTGQGVAMLQKVSETARTVWFLEEADAGTIVGWTLMDNKGDFAAPNVTLVSTKTYQLFGPATFSAFYECKPNAPGLR